MKTDDVMTNLFCVIFLLAVLGLAFVNAGHVVLCILTAGAVVLVYGVAVGVFWGSNIK